MLSWPLIASAFMIIVFVLFLIWLYSIGKISMIGLFGIILLGLIFVPLSHYFYKNYWNDEE